MSLAWLDPSLDSKNTGDQIIADAVERELSALTGSNRLVRLPTQRRPTRAELESAREANAFVVGGTNILNGNIPRYHQWHMGPAAFKAYRGRAHLLGVGWWQYQSRVNLASQIVWKALLRDGQHSVRDTYTLAKLRAMGIAATYTGCVTMWELSGKTIDPGPQRSSVIATITDYHKNPVRDAKLFRELRSRYDHIYLWPQGAGDTAYVKHLAPNVELIGPRLRDFNDALDSTQFDYVGTRLHAGVRALQRGVGAFIVAVDNRATEMAVGTGLPVVSGSLNADDWQRIDSRAQVKITMPDKAIDQWRENLARQVERSA